MKISWTETSPLCFEAMCTIGNSKYTAMVKKLCASWACRIYQDGELWDFGQYSSKAEGIAFVTNLLSNEQPNPDSAR